MASILTGGDRVLAGLLAVVTLLAAGACATSNRQIGAAGHLLVSASLSPSTYYDEGKQLFLGVDTRAAGLTRKGSVFPLGVAVANKSPGSLTLRSESFVLEDDKGARYAVVGYEEWTEQYRRRKSDETLLEDFYGVLNARFLSYRRGPLRFFPLKFQGRVRVRELGRRTLASGYLYFPMPEGGVKGRRFTLLLKVDEHPETFVVRFKVR